MVQATTEKSGSGVEAGAEEQQQGVGVNSNSINGPAAGSQAEIAMQYAGRGWYVFPAPATGEKKGCMAGGVFPWQCSKNADAVRQHWRRYPDANIGIATGYGLSGIFVLDIDTLAGHAVDGLATLAALEATHGPLPPTLTAQSPSGGQHRYFKHPGGYIHSRDNVWPGIDVKGENSMVLAPPSIRPGKGAYTWLHDLPIAAAPEWLIEQVVDWEYGEREPHDDDTPQTDIALVTLAVQAIPNDDEPWSEWNRFGMAVFAATGGSAAGLQLFQDWSGKSTKHDAIDVEQRWENFTAYPPTNIGFGTLAFMASAADPHWRDSYDADIEATMAAANANPQYGDEEPATSDIQSPPPNDGPIIRLADWLSRDLEPPEFICGKWLTTTSRVIINAPTGSGKTLFGIALGMFSAAGLPFLHWQAARAINLLYVDGEMARRVMKGRMADGVARLGVPPPAGFHMLSHEDITDGAWQPLNTLPGQGLIENQLARIGKVDLIIFDNVMSLIQGDQKDEEGWTKVMPWVRSLTRRRIAQVWLHHTGHDTTRGYGTKTRDWQMDNVVHMENVERTDTDVSFQLSFQKAREREPATRMDFRDIKIWLANNQWNWEAPNSGAALGNVSPLGKKFYEALCFATAASGRNFNGCPAATIEEWKTSCVQAGLIDPVGRPDAARTLLNKHRRELIAANYIASNEEIAWTLAANPQADAAF